MLMEIGTPENVGKYVAKAKDKNDPFRLMGFGHRVYKNYDPRARIMQSTTHQVLKELGKTDDPLLHVAMELEQIALKDEYFIEKKLYPNIDFYSGITLKAMGFPTDMFTVLFAVARTVGWIAQWAEMIEDPSQKIGRPRQLYVGPPSATTCRWTSAAEAGPVPKHDQRGGREAALRVCGGDRTPPALPPTLRLGGDPRLPGQAGDSRRRDDGPRGGLRPHDQRRGTARPRDGRAGRRRPAGDAPRCPSRRRAGRRGPPAPPVRLRRESRRDRGLPRRGPGSCAPRDGPAGLAPARRLGPVRDRCRAILGQQVSVAAAIGLAGKLVAAFGTPLAAPVGGLTHVFPAPPISSRRMSPSP